MQTDFDVRKKDQLGAELVVGLEALLLVAPERAPQDFLAFGRIAFA